jgi:tetratricopeptide (TPR) repeat protein
VPALADGFCARAETAADLAAALVARAVVVLVPVRVAGERPGSWLESCGKTQLAARVAELLWRLRRVELLVWVVATSRASVLSGYLEAAVDAMGADPEGDGESVAARFACWLGETSRPWLVVLDDLRDVADLEGLWPAGPAGRVVVTTANLAAFSGEQRTLIHQVGVLRPDEALSYLTGRLAADPDKLTGAAGLVQDLRYEPLALAQASAVIASSALSCRDYQDGFARRRQQMAKAADGEPPAASVTWAISAEHADRLSPGGTARSLLALAALLDGHGFPSAVFTTPAAREFLAGQDGEGTADGEHRPEALLAAERAGLLSADLAGTVPLVRMNAVVQAAVRAALPAEMRDRAATAAADALLQAWPATEQPIWLTGALRSCAVSLQGATGDTLWANGCHPLLLRAGLSLDHMRLTGAAVAYWSDLAEVSARILGRGHPDTLAVGDQLAGAYLAAGRASQAVSWFGWVLAERVRVLGPDHPSAIAARCDLGRALVAATQFGDAVAALSRVVGDYERVSGADQLDTLGARDELASAYHAAGQFADAIGLCRRTLASRELSQGARHPDTRATRQQLAAAYLGGGRLRHAISQYKQVLADSEYGLGPDHPDTIAARASLAYAYHCAGRTAPALQLYEQTHAAYERVLGPDHPDTLATTATLARSYGAAGRVTDAIALLRDTIARCEQALPPGDPSTDALRHELTSMTGG